MKKLVSIFIAALTAAGAYAADQIPLLNGTLTMGKEHRFMLVSVAGKSSSWLKLGDSFEDYTIKAFDAASNTLDLEHGGKVVHVKLVSDAAVVSAPATPAAKATLADAEDLFKAMRFDDMMKKLLDGQKKVMGPMMQQQISQSMARMNLNLSDEDKAAFMAMQSKMIDNTLSAITSPEMRSAMAQIYSDVFSKDELNAMAAFYSTPTGEALTEKQPEVQQKMMATMMPMIMQNQQAAAQEMRDFMTGIKTKYATGGTSTPPATTKP